MYQPKTVSPSVVRLDYVADATRLFHALRDLPWAVWLDSGRPAVTGGRYDIIAADPSCYLLQEEAEAILYDRAGQVQAHGEILGLLRQQLAERAEGVEGVPFSGGAIGYLGYDFGRGLMRLPARPGTSLLPQAAIGLYDWAVVIDHAARSAWLVSAGRDPATMARWGELRERLAAASEPSPTEYRFTSQPQSNLSRADYADAFARIQRYIRDGDCYQVNFAQRFRAGFQGDAWALYRTLRRRNPAPYGAYLQLPFGTVLSSSPEQFVALHEGHVVTRPIKGTRRRGETTAEDEQLRQALEQSDKDRAENLMIVDLLRNDLGKVCVPGSVRVPALFEVESFATVHHLVSTVEGRLRAEEDAFSLLAATFPGGSITGAPKKRSMEIIDELEPDPRSLYCGSIGWIGYNGDMDSNIVIRTLIIRDGQAHYWAGGGIVADSDEAAEYQESLDKAAAFFQLVDRGRSQS